VRVLGPAIIDWQQQRKMRELGHKHLIVRRDRVFEDAAAKAEIGDIWWVKEPFFEVKSPQAGCPEIHEMLIGYGFRHYDVPAHIKPWSHVCRWIQRPAQGLRRGESLAYLEIVEAVTKPEPGWLCSVHLQNIDVALKAVAA